MVDPQYLAVVLVAWPKSPRRDDATSRRPTPILDMDVAFLIYVYIKVGTYIYRLIQGLDKNISALCDLEMLTLLLHASSVVLPTRLQPSAFDPKPVVVGGTTANILFGKLQRAAQLPTSLLSKNPHSAVDDRGKLESLLWSSEGQQQLEPSSNLLT